MLFLTAASIGICVGMMRSAFSIALIAVMIAATFALATAVSPGPASYFNLLIAIIGYNAGLIAFLAGLFALDTRRTA
ncbi:hypothetical protein PMI07_003849 [Rhizobium sp. CF080]|uniref:hypothetical protein n=1 Tax=Rhizobium sp. (strain CF080) TaxID=1144310 RepID=UPI000271ABAE|nr:hypothetical protein [Rhizobium sp. CF080]EUC00563.1 hypothetical protein PMI07_003849 [Rhizobium sp. CF080]